MIKRLFTEHPESVNESYTEHMGVALSFAGPLAIAAIQAFVHAFLPFLFEKSASTRVKQLYARMTSGHRANPPAQAPAGATADYVI